MPSNRAFEAAVLVVLVAPMTVYLAAPTILGDEVAQAECEELVTVRLDGTASAARAEWELLPAAHWTCTHGGTVVADFGWWAHDASAADATMLR